MTDNTGVGGWAKEKGAGDKVHGDKARELLMIVLVIVQVSKTCCDGTVHKKACPHDRSPGCFYLADVCAITGKKLKC